MLARCPPEWATTSANRPANHDRSTHERAAAQLGKKRPASSQVESITRCSQTPRKGYPIPNGDSGGHRAVRACDSRQPINDRRAATDTKRRLGEDNASGSTIHDQRSTTNELSDTKPRWSRPQGGSKSNASQSGCGQTAKRIEKAPRETISPAVAAFRHRSRCRFARWWLNRLKPGLQP